MEINVLVVTLILVLMFHLERQPLILTAYAINKIGGSFISRKNKVKESLSLAQASQMIHPPSYERSQSALVCFITQNQFY